MKKKSKLKTKQLHMIKKAAIVGAVVVLGGAGVYGYAENKEYAPQRASNEINDNRVVFPEEEQKNQAENEQGKESDLWEQNTESQDKMNLDQVPGVGALFETSQSESTEEEKKSEKKSDKNEKEPEKQNPKAVVKVGDDNKKSDDDTIKVVVPKNGNNGNGGNDKNNGAGKEDPNSDNKVPTKPQDPNKEQPDTPDTPEEPTTPEQPDTPEDPVTPEPKPPAPQKEFTADRDRDVERKDSVFQIMGEGDNYVDIPENGWTEPTDVPQTATRKLMLFENQGLSKGSPLYFGQELTEKIILCAIDAYVWYQENPFQTIVDTGVKRYRISQKNLRVNTEKTPIPATAPEKELRLAFQWRESETSPWQDLIYEDIWGIKNDTYTLTIYDARVILADYGENQIADITGILNLEENSKIYLTQYYNLIHKDVQIKWDEELVKIDKIFPGWSETEDGKPVPIPYTLSERGRKVLYPLAMTDVPEGYQAALRRGTLPGVGSTHYIQVLSGYTGNSDELEVPVGINDVNFSDNEKAQSFFKIHIPSSVINIDLSGKLFATAGYEVDEDNVNYTAENGLLFNKEKTSVLAFPTDAQSISLPEEVTEIAAEFSPNLKSLHVHSIDVPQLDTVLLEGTSGIIYVPDEAYYRYVRAWDSIQTTDWKLCKESEEDPFDYIVDNGFIVSTSTNPHILNSVYTDKRGKVRIPEYIDTIQSKAFDHCDEVTAVATSDNLKKIESQAIVADNIEKIILEAKTPPQITADSFGDLSGKKNYIQIPEDAYDAYVKAWSSILGEDLLRDLLCTTEEVTVGNFIYELESGSDFATLTGVVEPEIVEALNSEDFVAPENKTINEIGDYAFSNCSNMRFIEIPETVKRIGENAFDECPNVEIILSLTKDRLSIGSNAFEGAALNNYGVFFNAQEAVFEENYIMDPDSFTVYAPENAEGYADHYSMAWTRYYAEPVPNQENEWIAYGEKDRELAVLTCMKGVEGDILIDPQTTELGMIAFWECRNLTGFDESGIQNIKELDPFCFYNTGIRDFTVRNGWLYHENTFFGMDLDTLVFEAGCNYEWGGHAVIDSQVLNEVSVRRLVLPDELFNFWTEALTTCYNLEELVFTSEDPANLCTMQSPFVMGCDFDGVNTRVVLEDAAEGLENEYILAWRASVAAWFECNEDDISQEDLLNAENTIRGWFGLEPEETILDREAEPADYVLSEDGATLEKVNRKLTEVVIPEGVTDIDAKAFVGCSNLRHLELPSTLFVMQSNVFSYCYSLQTIVFKAEEPPLISMDEYLTAYFGLDWDRQIQFILRGDATGKQKEYFNGLYSYVLGYTPAMFGIWQNWGMVSEEDEAYAKEVMAEALNIPIPQDDVEDSEPEEIPEEPVYEEEPSSTEENTSQIPEEEIPENTEEEVDDSSESTTEQELFENAEEEME